MPQYVFRLCGMVGGTIDIGAQEFASDSSARNEAETSARELEAEALRSGSDYAGCWYEVLDEQGYRIATIPISRPGTPIRFGRHEAGLRHGLIRLNPNAAEHTIH
jgi:hypothetical protein